jgi:hypothetical protein
MNALKNSWKTTLIGLGMGAFNLLIHGCSWQQVAASVLISAFGIVCKDFDITHVPTLPEGK